MKKLLVFSILFVLSGGACNIPSSQPTLPHPMEMNLPAPSFSRPDPKPLQRQLENGLTVYLVPNSRVPLVTVTAFVGSGTAHGAREGAAEALLLDLRRGPGNLASGEFAEALYRLAARQRVLMGPEETEITFNVASEDAEEALVLLAGTLRRPAIQNPASLSQDRFPETASLETAVARFKEAVLGQHPYGRIPNSDDFLQLTRNDVADYHHRYFVPSTTVLAISGDFDPAQMEQTLERELGDWDASAPPDYPVPPDLQPAPELRLLTFPAEKLQGWVVLGHELPPVPEEDWTALEVMNYILGGGHFDTRLFRAARDRRGLTNDDSGFLEPVMHGPGTYSFRTYGRPQVVRLLIELTLQEIERIRNAPVTDQELFVARGALADGEFAMRFADAEATARSFALEWLRYGNHSRSASYPDRIRAVTAEDVQRAAVKYLHPERVQIVVVGPIEQIENAPAREGERPLREWN